MGACLSVKSNSSSRKPCANLVSAAGELRQYPLPVTVSQVLHFETTSPHSFFVCDSDCLDFDAFIPSLDLEDKLEPVQVYFVLPVSKLKHRLAPSDMAALAVKASVALNTSSTRRQNRKARISPVVAKEESWSSDHHAPPITVKHTSRVQRSGSLRKMKRYSSRRSKLSAPMIRIRLATITEESELLN